MHNRQEILYYKNFDLENLVTPVDPDVFEALLVNSNYDKQETKFIVDGFLFGFPLGYVPKTNVQVTFNNLRLTVGTRVDQGPLE